MRIICFLSLSITLCLLLAIPASANIVTYTDRSAWATALGGPYITINFESFEQDTSFASSPLDVGPFVLRAENSLAGRDLVDVQPFMFTPVPDSFGNAAVDVYVYWVDIGRLFYIDFATPVQAFFADFLWAGNTTLLST